MGLAQPFGVKVADVPRETTSHLPLQHLVEITIVNLAVPTDRDHRTAHQACHRRRVKGLNDPLHVSFVLALIDQVLKEAADGHVRDREQPIEFQTMLAAQIVAIRCLQFPLIRRQ